MNLLDSNISGKLYLGKKSEKKNTRTWGGIVWDIIIGMTLLVKSNYIKKSQLCVCVCISFENFDNKLLVGVEFIF